MSSNQDRPEQYRYPEFEDLTFHPAATPGTLGVELELQIIDPDSGELVSGAPRILDACAEEQLAGVDGEFLQSMLEVKTGVCRDVADVRAQLFPLMRRVRHLAHSLGYDLALGATHPFSRAHHSAIAPGERYDRIRKRQGWLAYQEAIFGLHIHVGVPGADEAIGLVNLLVQYLPHMLALSANSPFWQGIDTSHASTRAVMFRPSPNSGIPQYCASWEDFGRYCHVLHDGGAIEATKDLYWDVRPRPQIGTIEFRICDVPASLSTVLGLAALARCLVLDGLRLLEAHPQFIKGDPARFWLAAENKGRAARYGLQASCVRRPGGRQLTLAEDTARLLERLTPVAREVGEEGFLQVLRPDRFESGADRLRRLYRQTGSWQALSQDMRGRWARELDEAPHAPAAAAPAPAPALALKPRGRVKGVPGV